MKVTRPHVKLFSTLRQNDEFIEFLQRHPDLVIEGEPEVLTIYINSWLEEHPDIDIIKISEPYWGGTHMYVFLWYVNAGEESPTPHEDAGAREIPHSRELQ